MRLTSTHEELIKEQGRLRRQLDKLRRHQRRSVSSLHSLSESSSASTSSSSSSSVDAVLLEQGAASYRVTASFAVLYPRDLI